MVPMPGGLVTLTGLQAWQVTGAGGSSANHVQAVGGSMGARFSLTSNTSILPELGIFDFIGEVGDKPLNGWGLQYGIVLSARID
jgi:hypothetical protein